MPYCWSDGAVASKHLARYVMVNCVLPLVLRARWMDRSEATLLYKGYLETQIT